MKLVIIGDGLDYLRAIANWIPGAYYSPLQLKLGPGINDTTARQTISSLSCDTVVDHRLVFHIPMIEEIWPNCKYLVIRQWRECSITSMVKAGLYAPDDPSNRWLPASVDDSADQLAKCSWYYNRLRGELSKHMEEYVEPSRLFFAIEDTPENIRHLIAGWIGMPELGEVPIFKNSSPQANEKPVEVPTSNHIKGVTKPDFMVIGAQKAGTTWLARNLEKHPKLRMAVPKLGEPHWYKKEVQFFNSPLRLERGLDYYFSYFEKDEGEIIGDMTPDYCIVPVEVIALIKKVMPDIKLVLMLRNPIERHWSAMMMFYRYGFSKEYKGNGFELVPREEIAQHIRRHYYTIRSNYTRILDNWSQFYDESQLKITLFEDIAKRPKELLYEVMDHVGLPTDIDPSIFPLRAKIHAGVGTTPPPYVLDTLKKIYKEEIENLIDRLGDRVAHWKTW